MLLLEDANRTTSRQLGPTRSDAGLQLQKISWTQPNVLLFLGQVIMFAANSAWEVWNHVAQRVPVFALFLLFMLAMPALDMAFLYWTQLSMYLYNATKRVGEPSYFQARIRDSNNKARRRGAKAGSSEIRETAADSLSMVFPKFNKEILPFLSRESVDRLVSLYYFPSSDLYKVFEAFEDRMAGISAEQFCEITGVTMHAKFQARARLVQETNVEKKPMFGSSEPCGLSLQTPFCLGGKAMQAVADGAYRYAESMDRTRVEFSEQFAYFVTTALLLWFVAVAIAI